jgi:drug/metabolite transporter (DMT)-like permease
MALVYMGPLTLTGLRYFLAFLLLLPFTLRRRVLTHLTPQLWLRLFFTGLSFYVVGNGALYWGLKYIPATTGSFLLAFTPLLVLGMSILWLQEIPTHWQLVGMFVGLGGSALFFSTGLKTGEPLGIGIVVIGLGGSASFSVLGRSMARSEQVDTLLLTSVPLAVGSSFLLPLALWVEGLPQPSVAGGSILIGLTLLNTTALYLLYNHALKMLTAFEMSIMTNLAPIVTALLAYVSLGEKLYGFQWIGILALIMGVILVQRGKQSSEKIYSNEGKY